MAGIERLYQLRQQKRKIETKMEWRLAGATLLSICGLAEGVGITIQEVKHPGRVDPLVITESAGFVAAAGLVALQTKRYMKLKSELTTVENDIEAFKEEFLEIELPLMADVLGDEWQRINPEELKGPPPEDDDWVT